VNDRESTSLPARLDAVLSLDPSAPAIELNGRWTTWGDLRRTGALIQAELRRAGAGAGARVGIVLRNQPTAVAALLSALIARQSVVSLSHVQPPSRTAREIRDLGLAAVIGTEADWRQEAMLSAAAAAGTLAVALPAEPGGRPGVVYDPGAGEPTDLSARTSPGVALSMLTSGTTGTPKRVPVSYANLQASLSGSSHYGSGQPEAPRLRSGVAVLVAPILHTSGMFRLILNMSEGRRAAMLERFDVAGLLRLLAAYDARVLALPPTALRMILDAGADPALFRRVSAVICGTAPLAPELGDEFEAAYGVPVLGMYGATEFVGGVAGWTLAEHHKYRGAKRGAVGRLHPGVEARAVDPDTGRDVGFGEPGRLLVRTRQAAATAGRDADGWIATTDLAKLDADGFLWILGRLDDVIIRGGFKVSASAVSEVLKGHPGVLDAGVVGLPDGRLGEIPVAAVQAASGVRLDVPSLLAWARERLAPYQVPARVVEVAVLPRTPSMKIDQQALRELLAEPGA
jgi:acyl-CoA synthetase (AMP-forming)/AMP-acid ligase II